MGGVIDRCGGAHGSTPGSATADLDGQSTRETGASRFLRGQLDRTPRGLGRGGTRVTGTPCSRHMLVDRERPDCCGRPPSMGRMLLMMAIGVDLERVRRKSGGRIHLTPHVPETGTVVSLCNQSFAEGTYERTEAEADCRNCLRRRDDPARVSSAFFQSDVGSELLERSLEQARTRRATRPAPEQAPVPSAASRPAPPRKPAASPAPPSRPGPQPVPAIPELRSHTQLRRTFENVFTSPQGVIIRVSNDGSVDHVTFDGPVDVRRRGGVVTVRAGDVVLELMVR